MSVEPWDEARELDRLGEFIAEFSVKSLRQTLQIMGSILLFVVGLSLLAFTIYDLTAANRGGRPHGRMIVKGGLGAIGALVWSVVCWRTSRRIGGLRILVFQEGLARIQRDKVEIMQWEEIESLVRSAKSNYERDTFETATMQLTLTDHGGREFVFDDYVSDLKKLREIAEARTCSVMLPRALERVDEDDPIAFGEILVEKQGMVADGTQLPWQRYDRGEATRGTLMLYAVGQQKPFKTIATAKVPNYHVLLALARTLSEESTAS